MPPRIRSYGPADLAALIAIQRECFPPPFPQELWWNAEQIATHARVFPEGALCAESGDGTLVASATAHVQRWSPDDGDHTWAQASDGGYLRNHDPAGDTLYGVDVAVRPAWRGQGIARALYQARYALVRRLRLRRFLAGSRLAGYAAYRDAHPGTTPEDYAREVLAGRVLDPVITPQLSAGLEPIRVVRAYLDDVESAGCALLMEWRNPDFR